MATTNLTGASGSASGTDVTALRVAASADDFKIPNDGTRPLRLLVENLDVASTDLVFARSGKFANGDTMGSRTVTVDAATLVLLQDFPVSEFGTSLGFTVSNFTDATVLPIY